MRDRAAAGERIIVRARSARVDIVPAMWSRHDMSSLTPRFGTPSLRGHEGIRTPTPPQLERAEACE